MKRILPCLIILAAACGPSTTPSSAAKPPDATPPVAAKDPNVIELDGKIYRVSGPYDHDNLAVYLLHTESRDDRDFITLDEGLKSGKVTVTEKGEEGQVSELLLENAGDVSLFIQEGDRVKGGKQDRIVGLSFVVPAKSGKKAIPSFCVERGRWSPGKGGGAFSEVSNYGLASKDVRAAAKIAKNQQEVWKEVDGINRAAPGRIGNRVGSTSLNETADSPEAKKSVEPFEKKLRGILEGKPDAVGVAFAMNGAIEEVNIYPGAKLLAKLYPRLLESYALSAVLNKKEGASPAAAAVAAFMKEGREKAKRTEDAVGNLVTLCDYEKQVRCRTEFEGKVVHVQWMRHIEGAVGFTDIERPTQQRQQREEQNQAPRR